MPAVPEALARAGTSGATSRMTNTQRTVTVALALFAAACMQRPSASRDSTAAPPPSAPTPPSLATDSSRQVELRTDRSSYHPGDQVTMTIVNHATGSWAFNPCTRVIEHETPSGWVSVPDARRCTMEAWILKPNETRTATSNFDSSLQPGRYRLVIGFSGDGPPDGRQTTATSEPVTIAN
jgi:hypothetical protein